MTQSSAVLKNSAWNARDLAFTAMFSALLAVCSWITIPSAVPFTLQTFAVFLILECLGGKKGFFAILVYLLTGAAGAPVFAHFSGGISILSGMTGGYLLGFLLTAGLYRTAESFSGALWKKLPFRILILTLGLLICYLFGTVWFMVIYTRQKEAVSLISALGMCVFPFLIPDGIKLALAVMLSEKLKKYIKF